jgi:hypothetical protein
MNRSSIVADTCRKCSAVLEPENRVVLWDGFAYCQSCVAGKSAALLDWAKSHPQRLEEVMPENIHARLPGLHRVLSKIGMLYLLLELAGGIWCLNEWYVRESRDPDLLVLAVVLLIGGPAFFLVKLSMFWPFVRHSGPMPGIVVEDGRVRYTKGDAVTREFAIADCSWYPAPRRSRFSASAEDTPVAQELMALCDRSGMYLKGIALCGFTPEMREIWTAFLSLAGARKLS